eukprot:1196405-Prorocentrum_minimum.AAC.2
MVRRVVRSAGSRHERAWGVVRAADGNARVGSGVGSRRGGAWGVARAADEEARPTWTSVGSSAGSRRERARGEWCWQPTRRCVGSSAGSRRGGARGERCRQPMVRRVSKCVGTPTPPSAWLPSPVRSNSGCSVEVDDDGPRGNCPPCVRDEPASGETPNGVSPLGGVTLVT